MAAYTDSKHNTMELPLIDKERESIIGNIGMLHFFFFKSLYFLFPPKELGLFYKCGFDVLNHILRKHLFFLFSVNKAYVMSF